MKKFIIALFLGTSALLQAQNTISGTVTDMFNQPIKGVSVSISELHKGTTTDENGKYQFSNLPNRTLKINFTMLGFATQNQSVSIGSNENILNVLLEEAIFEMDEVIVSTAFNKIQSQNVMKVEHETIKNLQKKTLIFFQYFLFLKN